MPHLILPPLLFHVLSRHAPPCAQVLSPMGGTYYRSPAPGEPPFCREGDKVVKGQTICIIEAMKLMNEIEVRICAP